MDTLTFNAPTLFRHLTFSEAKKAPILEVTLAKALEGLEMTMSQVRRSPNLTCSSFVAMVTNDRHIFCVWIVRRTVSFTRL